MSGKLEEVMVFFIKNLKLGYIEREGFKKINKKS
jgi:hypothetical protein